MNYTLHKISEIFIITSDEKTQNNELYYVWGGIGKAIGIYTKKESDETNNDWCKKVIAQQNQIGFSDNIPEEKLRGIGWFDVDKLFQEDSFDVDVEGHSALTTYAAGFQKAQELLSDRKFTKDDLINVFILGGKHKVQNPDKFIDKCEEIIQSLSQKSWDVELEMEDKIALDGHTIIGKEPKLTNGKVTITKIL